MHHHLTEITTQENQTRIAITRKYPGLLPFVLELKRLIHFLRYTLNPRFKLSQTHNEKWFHLTEHSSPLYRKYNTVELDKGKIENIKIAIRTLDGLIIPPGKIFSFWKFVGRPSQNKGFKAGLVLADGQLKEATGGGLCQLSNLLGYMFGCTECAFIERKHHSRDVFPDSGRTVPFASGATVFFNLIDLKIQNNYPFPIRINLHTTDTQLRGSISAPVQLDYFVKLEEKRSGFIRSAKTGRVYRCNELYRVFYAKQSKQKIKENLLWRNTAQVVYDTKHIASQIVDSDTSLPSPNTLT